MLFSLSFAQAGSIDKAYWASSSSGTSEITSTQQNGALVYACVKTIGYNNGQQVYFDYLYEDDTWPLSDDILSPNPLSSATISNNIACSSWTAEWQPDAGSEAEFYFDSQVSSSTKSSSNLNVAEPLITANWYDSSNNIISQANNGNVVKMCVSYSKGYVGKTVTFNIYESDTFNNDFINSITATVDSSSKACATWTVQWVDDSPSSEDEFIFKPVINSYGASVEAESNQLNVPSPYKPTVIACDDKTVLKGSPVTLTAKLEEDNLWKTDIANKKVKFYIDNNYVGEDSSTNSDGIAEFSYTPQNIGGYTIKAKFEQDSTYGPSEDTATLTVKSSTGKNTVIDCYSKEAEAGQQINLEAKFKETTGQVIANKKIQFYVNDIYKGENNTNANGLALLSYVAGIAGDYTIKAKFAGDMDYNYAEDIATLEVSGTAERCTNYGETKCSGDSSLFCSEAGEWLKTSCLGSGCDSATKRCNAEVTLRKCIESDARIDSKTGAFLPSLCKDESGKYYDNCTDMDNIIKYSCNNEDKCIGKSKECFYGCNKAICFDDSIEVLDLVLTLDSADYIKKNLDKELNPYTEKVVTSFDNLICLANINIAKAFVDYSIYGTLSGEISSGIIECSDYTCSINIPSDKIQKGEIITCHIREKSDAVSVAKYNYIFFPQKSNDIDDAKKGFDFFLKTSAFESKEAKAIYYNANVCDFAPLVEAYEISQTEASNIITKIENCAFSKYGDFDTLLDRTIGISTTLGTGKLRNGAFTSYQRPYIVFLGADEPVLAHEIGHSYNLADEYNYQAYLFYEKPNNEYPDCCIDKPTMTCVQKGGSCVLPDNCGIGSNEIVAGEKGKGILGCPAEKVCCMPRETYEELGNNCWPINFRESYQSKCAGMPLNADGTISRNSDGSFNLNAPYRSIMGGSTHVTKETAQWYGLNYPFAKYPPNSPYPLSIVDKPEDKPNVYWEVTDLRESGGRMACGSCIKSGTSALPSCKSYEVFNTFTECEKRCNEYCPEGSCSLDNKKGICIKTPNKNPVLTVDPVVFQSKNATSLYGRNLDDNINDYKENVVTNYDPLICKLGLNSFLKEGKADYFFESNKRGILQSGTIESCPIKFEDWSQRPVCEARLSPGNLRRGEIITCKMTYDGINYTSNRVNVANYVFIFLPFENELSDQDVDIMKSQVGIFLDMTELSPTDLKLIFRKEGCNVTIESERALEEIRRCAESFGEDINPARDKVIGISDSVGFTSFIEPYALVTASFAMGTLAHELGHTYGLCDEYAYKIDKFLPRINYGWYYQDLELKEFGRSGCLNSYPSCCIDNPNFYISYPGGVDNMGNMVSNCYFNNACNVSKDWVPGRPSYPSEGEQVSPTEVKGACAGTPYGERLSGKAFGDVRSIMGTHDDTLFPCLNAPPLKVKYPDGAPYPLSSKKVAILYG